MFFGARSDPELKAAQAQKSELSRDELREFLTEATMPHDRATHLARSRLAKRWRLLPLSELAPRAAPMTGAAGVFDAFEPTKPPTRLSLGNYHASGIAARTAYSSIIPPVLPTKHRCNIDAKRLRSLAEDD